LRAAEKMMAPDSTATLGSRLWTARDVAEMLGVPRRTVYEYARRGLLPHVQIGRHVRFIQRDLEEKLRELSVP
jgi:excisionase family DNA binding protein